jgi:HK97 family phage major capsid protein
MTIEELKAKLRQLNAEAMAILDKADAENEGEMDEAATAAFDTIEAELNTIEAQIEKAEASSARREKIQARQQTLGTSRGRVVSQEAPAPEPVRDPTGGFANMAEFGLSVMAASANGGAIDQRLLPLAAPTNFNQESGTELGYLVPLDMRSEIWELVWDEQDLLSMIDSEPTNSNQVGMLKDETTPWGSSGITAKWRSEGKVMTPDTLSLEQTFLALHELYAFVLATDELLQDAPRLASRLSTKSAEAIRWKITEAIIEGSGSGQPLGYRNGASLVSVAKEAGQSADTIVAKNIAKMYSRMLPQGIGRALWTLNSDALPEIMTLQLGDKAIWTPPNEGFKFAPGGFLLGRPIMLTEHNETLGDLHDIEFIDPMGYYGATKQGGVKFDSSIHLYFDYGIQAFRWTFRFAGTPYMSAPVTPKKGSKTKSSFVALAARA